MALFPRLQYWKIQRRYTVLEFWCYGRTDSQTMVLNEYEWTIDRTNERNEHKLKSFYKRRAQQIATTNIVRTYTTLCLCVVSKWCIFYIHSKYNIIKIKNQNHLLRLFRFPILLCSLSLCLCALLHLKMLFRYCIIASFGSCSFKCIYSTD